MKYLIIIISLYIANFSYASESGSKKKLEINPLESVLPICNDALREEIVKKHGDDFVEDSIKFASTVAFVFLVKASSMGILAIAGTTVAAYITVNAISDLASNKISSHATSTPMTYPDHPFISQFPYLSSNSIGEFTCSIIGDVTEDGSKLSSFIYQYSPAILAYIWKNAANNGPQANNVLAQDGIMNDMLGVPIGFLNLNLPHKLAILFFTGLTILNLPVTYMEIDKKADANGHWAKNRCREWLSLSPAT